MKKQIVINILLSLVYEFTYAVSGIIIPKLILSVFGSEVNGLVSSLASFLSVFIVIEGGMSAVIGSKLYKPLVDKDNESLNKVVASGKLFYKKLSIYYACFALVVGILYPVFKHTPFSFSYIFFLVVILSMSTFISYNSYVVLSAVVIADNKSYVVYISYTIAAILNIVFVLIGVNVFPNIHFIKILTFLSFLINPIILNLYIKSHYKICKKTTADISLLDQRWSGFAHNLSSFIMNNVDIYVLTFFSTLSAVSIYSIYAIIITSIKQLVNTISNVLTPLLGKAKASNTNISNTFDFQLFITGIVTTVVFSCSYVLINPFIKIYTANIVDVNYIYPEFAYVFVTSELIACLTFPYINITYATGDYKGTKYLAYTETIVNVVLSVISVHFLGLIGVILSTLIARIIRITLQLVYLRKNEKDINIFKSLFKSVEKIIAVIIIVACLNNIVFFTNYTFFSWIINGIVCFIVSGVLCGAMSLIFDREISLSILRTIFIKRK